MVSLDFSVPFSLVYNRQGVGTRVDFTCQHLFYFCRVFLAGFYGLLSDGGAGN
jgi:hypothetical protein